MLVRGISEFVLKIHVKLCDNYDDSNKDVNTNKNNIKDSVNIVEAQFFNKNFDVCVVYSQEYKSFEIYAVTIKIRRMIYSNAAVNGGGGGGNGYGRSSHLSINYAHFKALNDAFFHGLICTPYQKDTEW